MNLTHVQIAGVTAAMLGSVFAGAYAVAMHAPTHAVLVATASAREVPGAAVDPTVPEASVVFNANTDAPEQQPPTF